MVRLQPLPGQEIAEPPITKPLPRGRQLTQPLPLVGIVRNARLTPRYPPGNSDQVTRPALAQPVVTLPYSSAATSRGRVLSFVGGAKRARTRPALSTRNLVKFHLIPLPSSPPFCCFSQT